MPTFLYQIANVRCNQYVFHRQPTLSIIQILQIHCTLCTPNLQAMCTDSHSCRWAMSVAISLIWKNMLWEQALVSHNWKWKYDAERRKTTVSGQAVYWHNLNSLQLASKKWRAESQHNQREGTIIQHSFLKCITTSYNVCLKMMY